jgi:energy-converting hydrogenase B subunit D
MALLFDSLLAVMLTGIAVAALIGKDTLRSIVLFVVFGVIMALAWLRLQAPDVALAEAAVGAGLTGVLLIEALAHVRRARRGKRE